MRRLIDELPPGFELSLLASEALDAPTEDAKQAARRAGLAALGVVAVAGAAVAVATTSGGATGVTAATAGSVGAKAAVPTAMAAWKVLAIGVVVGGVAAGTGMTIARAPEVLPATKTTAPVASSSSPAARPIATHDLPPVPPIESASPVVPATSASAPRPMATSRPSARPEATFEPPPPAAPVAEKAAPSADLAAEVRTLDAARVALERHDARAALRELDAYAAAYPNGTLAPEATALRVEALAMRGDRAEATRLATELLAAHPSGPYRKRLEKALGGPLP